MKTADRTTIEGTAAARLRRSVVNCPPLGDGTWRLFDIARDPGETRDLALAEPDRLKALTQAWDAYAKDVEVILPDKQVYRP